MTASGALTDRPTYAALAAELRARLAAASLGGPAASRERHVARGKLLPRDRIERLLDEGSPFIEIAPLAAEGMYGGEAPEATYLRRMVVGAEPVNAIVKDETPSGACT